MSERILGDLEVQPATLAEVAPPHEMGDARALQEQMQGPADLPSFSGQWNLSSIDHPRRWGVDTSSLRA